MEFRTIVDVPKPDFEIGVGEEILFVGSCFADSIGKRFQEEMFRATVNPFGDHCFATEPITSSASNPSDIRTGMFRALTMLHNGSKDSLITSGAALLLALYSE